MFVKETTGARIEWGDEVLNLNINTSSSLHFQWWYSNAKYAVTLPYVYTEIVEFQSKTCL